jgi:beta-mannosidase
MEKLRKVPYTLMAANERAPESERSNVFTRKAPFHYGWDWGPRLVTCGIWKPVKIRAWDHIRMDDLYVKPKSISKEKASYQALAEFTASKDSKVSLEVWVDSLLVTKADTILRSGKTEIGIGFVIEKPELWWTNGLGGHKLYQVEMRMLSGNTRIQTVSTRIGVRTVELIQNKDSIGTSFGFRLNGIPVFMKGSNYIPSDIFTTRNTQSNYRRVIGDAVSANMNMIRIWGGAIYENDEFYDLLDENGLLAWNDFMFACSVQPVDSAHLENIRKEAGYNVKRLRNHPSVAVWCGNNENLRAWHDWGWKGKYSGQDAAVLWGGYEKIFYEILPDAVKKFHPEVPYWPSSPQAAGNKLSDRISGDEHDWSIWFGDTPFSDYGYNVPRFVSEYGLQSFPEMKTIRAFASDSDMAYRSPVMEHRQRSAMPWLGAGFNGNEMIKTYIARYYKLPADFGAFAYLSQLMQAEGVKYAIETHRRNMPRCMGSLYWQLNDCWPTMSWSGVDYFGRWKALHYAVKKAYQEMYPIIFNNDGTIQVTIASDAMTDKRVTIVATLYDFNGKSLWRKQVDTLVNSNTSRIYMSVSKKELLLKGDPKQTVLEVVLSADNRKIADNLFYLTDCKDLRLTQPVIDRTVTKTGEQEYEITLQTDKLAKNVAMFTASSEGRFSDNYFDMIPGRTYKIRYSGTTKDLQAELILQCVNELYTKK